MSRYLIVPLVLCFFGIAPIAQARVFESASLYAVELPVPDQERGQQDQRLREALTAVLVRLTGDRDIASDALAEPVLSRADSLVQAFGYSSKTVSEPDPLDPEGPPQEREQLHFSARFDPGALNDALLASRLPVWGTERPITVVWLAMRDDNRDFLVSDAEAPEQAEALLDTARARGLPVLLPSQSTIRASGLTPAVVLDGNDDAVLAASDRLGGQAVAIGRLQRAGAGWQGYWSLLLPDSPPEVWDVSGVTKAKPQAAGIHRIADVFASRFARLGMSETDSTIYINIQPLEKPEDYARVLNYMQGLSLVEEADLLRLHAGEGLFRVALRGDATQFEQSIGLANVLRKDWRSGGDPRIQQYRLIK